MNRILSLFAGLMLLCIFTPPVSAQGGYEVKGVIQDQLGPVIGATIMEQGTSNGTSSGLDGDFILVVSGPDAVVEISCIGYKALSFKASELPASITLHEDTLFLDDVVVIGLTGGLIVKWAFGSDAGLMLGLAAVFMLLAAISVAFVRQTDSGQACHVTEKKQL